MKGRFNMSDKTHKQNLIKAQNAVIEKESFAQKGSYRQQYHFMALTGWINDPNGLIFWHGQYHLFYQYNPYASVWGSMHWGHAVSNDLINWEYLPIALAPSETYDDNFHGGCFSGSAVSNDDTLMLIYTAATKCGDVLLQTQCLATSKDGITFEKYENNPVIKELPPQASSDFRDPKVLKYKDTWYMVVGSSLGKGARLGGDGCAQMYKSTDLINWEYCGVIAKSNGKLGTMWECPDLFPIGDKWVLMFSPMFYGKRKTVYLLGDMDFDNYSFSWDYEGEIDYGFEYYAPQSFLDNKGRRILIAWANGWEWMPWWKDFGPTASEGWCGHFAIPREVRIAKDKGLQFVPINELESLRTDCKSYPSFILGSEEKKEIHAGDGIHCELLINIDVGASTARQVILDVRQGENERVRIVLSLKDKEVLFSRINSIGQVEELKQQIFADFGKSLLTMHLFLDTCSVELFVMDYKMSFSGNFYFNENSNLIFLESKCGYTKINSVHTYALSIH
nr:putative GH32 family protein [Micropterna sequax]